MGTNASAGSADGGLYIAFNTSHRPAVVDLPPWAGRRWQLYADSGKVLSHGIGLHHGQHGRTLRTAKAGIWYHGAC